MLLFYYTLSVIEQFPDFSHVFGGSFRYYSTWRFQCMFFPRFRHMPHWRCTLSDGLRAASVLIETVTKHRKKFLCFFSQSGLGFLQHSWGNACLDVFLTGLKNLLQFSISRRKSRFASVFSGSSELLQLAFPKLKFDGFKWFSAEDGREKTHLDTCFVAGIGFSTVFEQQVPMLLDSKIGQESSLFSNVHYWMMVIGSGHDLCSPRVSRELGSVCISRLSRLYPWMCDLSWKIQSFFWGFLLLLRKTFDGTCVGGGSLTFCVALIWKFLSFTYRSFAKILIVDD